MAASGGIFYRIDNFIETGLLKNILETSITHEKIQVLIDCLSVSIAIYIIYKGYMMFAGRSQEPVKELLWDCVAKILIIAVLKNADSLYDLAINFINALRDWADGGNGIVNGADIIIAMMPDFDDALYQGTDGTLYPFLLVIAWISILLANCFVFFVYAITKITLTFLIVFAPIFIYCKLFGFLKNMFNQWVQLIIANILTLLLLSISYQYANRLIMSILYDYTKNHGFASFIKSVGEAVVSGVSNLFGDGSAAVAGSSISSTVNSAQTVAYLFCVCFMQVIMVKICVKIAEQTTSLSLEAAGMSTVAGAAGMAAGGAGIAVSKMSGITRLGASTLGTAAKFADNKITKGAFQSAGKAVSNKFSQWKGSISTFINTPRGG
jgi:type IV secretory pathway VirB6-like protein